MADISKKQFKNFPRRIMWGAILVFVGGVIFGAVKLAAHRPASDNQSVKTVDLSASDWVRGNRQAKLILLEYGDFQCPACGSYYLILKELEKQYGDKLGVAFRHFPLPFHKNAQAAALAAEAAGNQGKFFEMHDLLYENQSEWSESDQARSIFTSFATSLGLDLKQFSSDLDSKEVAAKIEQSYRSGIDLGVQGTPTFFLNGKLLENPRSLGEFKNVLDTAIAK